MNNLKKNRRFSFGIILLVYLIGTAVGCWVYDSLPRMDVLWRVGLGDFAATLVVWAAGLLFKNSSIYDPYWSVAPPVILALLGFARGVRNIPFFIVLGVLCLWSIRLTFNWAVHFQDLTRQDWRYDGYKGKYPKVWPLLNLFGIHLMPTLIVFLALVPSVRLTDGPVRFGFFAFPWVVLCLAAVFIQLVSDYQMYQFAQKPENRGEVNRSGLWKYSRHPNYLGEILLWWGIYGIAAASTPLPLYTAAGALLNTFLFVFVSIPLMEKRQLERRPAYQAYIATTGMLLPKWHKTEEKESVA